MLAGLKLIDRLVLLVPLAPSLAFVVLGASMLVRRPPSERAVAKLVSIAFTVSLTSALCLAGSFVVHGDRPIALALGGWFESAGYQFEASLLVDRLSVTLMIITAALCSLIGRFSSTYLVREPGQPRFYLLLSLFATGMFLLVMAGSLDLLIAGWELLGISSMLLIAFFHERRFPVRNALRTFTVYRACDIGLLTGAALLHHYGHTSTFVKLFGDVAWPAGRIHVSEAGATLIMLCLFWAACGKSALFPLGSWLPRAMEGPTPSSAIFYGALSVHAGAYLILRMEPLLEHAPIARSVIVLVGLLTAVHATLIQRVQTDVKSQLAYATSTQLGVIFVEIGLGLPRLALLHLSGHTLLRTLQLLRAPNAIHDVQQIRAAAGTERLETRPLSPTAFGRWLYQLSIERFQLDALLENLVARPVLSLAHAIEHTENRLVQLLARDITPTVPSEAAPSVARGEGSQTP